MSDFASCCLLSYNRPDFVRAAVQSAVENAGYPLEMIVHDDGSNPDTIEVLMGLRSAGLISLLMLNAETHNEGQGIALNRMFAAAKGDPIVKLDHDLVFEPDWLRRCVDLIDANHGDDETRTRFSDADPQIAALGLFKYQVEPVRAHEMFIAGHTSGGYVWEEHRDFVGSAMVIPRVAWEEFGPFEERSPAFAEDAIFKQAIRDRSTWCNALFPRDLARNDGFGPGPSTVVSMDEGEVVVTGIEDGPMVIG